MESRMKQSRDISPDRAKLQGQPKSKQGARKVQVVYYLSRGGQLEHPHFMEVNLSCNEQLYLRDVTDRLTTLRGKGMPSLFSWSCKRSYKNGYVWNDLSEDDIIYPVNGIEYVLKGSELFEDCSERYQQNKSAKLSNGKAASEGSAVAYSQEKVLNKAKSLVPRHGLMTDEAAYNSHEHVHMHGLPPKFHTTQNHMAKAKIVSEEGIGSSSGTPYRRRETHKSCCNSTVEEYKVCKSEFIDCTVDHGPDAATQTGCADQVKRCTKGVSTEEEEESNDDQNSTELSGGEESVPSSSSASSDATNHARIEPKTSKPTCKTVPSGYSQQCHENQNNDHTASKFRTFNAPNVLMQLISCGSIAVKDRNILLINPHRAHAVHTSDQNQPCQQIKTSNIKNRLHTKVVTRSLAKPTIQDELGGMSDNPRVGNLQIEEKEYFSGSLLETKTEKDGEAGAPTLKKCSSYNADRNSKFEIINETSEKESSGDDGSAAKTKCIPRKKSSKKQS